MVRFHLSPLLSQPAAKKSSAHVIKAKAGSIHHVGWDAGCGLRVAAFFAAFDLWRRVHFV